MVKIIIAIAELLRVGWPIIKEIWKDKESKKREVTEKIRKGAGVIVGADVPISNIEKKALDKWNLKKQ